MTLKYQKEFVHIVTLNRPELVLDMRKVCKEWRIGCDPVLNQLILYLPNCPNGNNHLKSQCRDFRCNAWCRRCDQWKEEEQFIECENTGYRNIINNCCLKSSIEGQLYLECDYCDDYCIF